MSRIENPGPSASDECAPAHFTAHEAARASRNQRCGTCSPSLDTVSANATSNENSAQLVGIDPNWFQPVDADQMDTNLQTAIDELQQL